ncbi:hypothetical protein HAZT_HAZT005234 [Hyalella azteca]|uniref:Ig-like domain-containing protein n=1 Tax=Hyalella azteca TaxID=294128 RepID=A0A6A0GV43_HYAAZ|nr:hypothetical protein HAZT_HAZT005234 [Hyalella azteca]
MYESQRQQQNLSAGVIIAVDSLVLQSAARSRTGRYYCVATNSVASTTSQPVLLKIKYKPVCASAPITYFIYDEPINVTCSIASYPPVHNIEWRWNGSGEITTTQITDAERSDTLLQDRVTAHFTVYPSKASDDRHLSCLGVNEMGAQRQPCNFSITVAKMPAPLSSCRLANITASSLSLTCETARTPDALYRAEVYLANNSLFANVTSQQPSFNVSRLDPATRYEIKVYVAHGPATSQPVHVSAFTSRTARRDRVNEDRTAVSSVVVVVVMVSVVTVVMVLITAVVIRLWWCNRRSRESCESPQNHHSEEEVSKIESGASSVPPGDIRAKLFEVKTSLYCASPQRAKRGPDVLSNIEETYKLLSPMEPPDAKSGGFVDQGQFASSDERHLQKKSVNFGFRPQVNFSGAKTPEFSSGDTCSSETLVSGSRTLGRPASVDRTRLASTRALRDIHGLGYDEKTLVPGGSRTVMNPRGPSQEIVCGVDHFFTAEESIV